MSLGLQALYALAMWQFANAFSMTYPLILVVLPGLVLIWFVLQPSFLIGAVLIAATNVVYHLGLLALWRWIRRSVRPAQR